MRSSKPAVPARTTAIDWRAVHASLENARKAIERGWSPGPAECRRILKARAEALAREPEAPHEPADSIDVIEFDLAHETYAVEASYVREVYPVIDLTPLPCTPAYVMGIVNVRGQVLSVIDIKRFFDLPAQGLTDLNKLIILRSEQMEFGILADRIRGTGVFSTGELQPSLPTLTGIRDQYLRGVSAGRVVILDAAKLLADKKLIVHEVVEL